jgi:adenine-specific DNA-methyltransferase
VVAGEQGGISQAVNWQGGGGFRVVTLGPQLYDDAGVLAPDIGFDDLAALVWYRATGTGLPPRSADGPSSFLGVQNGQAHHLLFGNGGELNHAALAALPSHDGLRVVWAARSRLGEAALQAAGVVFRQIPYALGTAHV